MEGRSSLAAHRLGTVLEAGMSWAVAGMDNWGLAVVVVGIRRTVVVVAVDRQGLDNIDLLEAGEGHILPVEERSSIGCCCMGRT